MLNMVQIKCPDCGKTNIREVTLLAYASLRMSLRLQNDYTHLMQCKDCKTIFVLDEDYETGELVIHHE